MIDAEPAATAHSGQLGNDRAGPGGVSSQRDERADSEWLAQQADLRARSVFSNHGQPARFPLRAPKRQQYGQLPTISASVQGVADDDGLIALRSLPQVAVYARPPSAFVGTEEVFMYSSGVVHVVVA